MSTTTSAAAPRDPGIDTLRGVAISMVLVLHFALAFGLQRSPLGDWLGRPLLRALVIHGNFGVTLFFVVSGFLITRNLLRRDGTLARVSLRRFWLERAARIGPPLLLALAIVLPLGLADVRFFDNADNNAALPAHAWWIVLASLLGFWHNLLMQHWGYFNYVLNVYWSLSVEEAFYLAFPLLCLLLRRDALIAGAALTLILLGPLYRAQHADSEIHYLYAYAACFDAIAVGVLTAMLSARVTLGARAARLVRSTAPPTLLALVLRGFGDDVVFSFTVLAFVAAFWIWARVSDPRESRVFSLVLHPLRALGRSSYELYLMHIVLLAGLRHVFDRETLGYHERLPLLVVYVVAAAMVAWVMRRFYSEPANRWLRGRWIGARPSGVAMTRGTR